MTSPYDYAPNGVDYDPDLLDGGTPPNRRRNAGDTQGIDGMPPQRRPSRAGRRPATKPQATERTSAEDNNLRRQAPQTRKATKTKEPKQPSSLVKFFTNPRTHAAFGVILICVAVFITIAAISFLRYGGADQSLVSSMSTRDIVESGAQVKNAAGPLGARLAQSWIAQGLGLGSLAMIVYLVALGLGLMGIKKCHFWSLTFKTLLVAITVSMVLGFVSLWLGTDYNYGGAHGHYINILLVSYIEWAGAALVSLALIAIVIIVYLNDLLRIYNSYRSIKRARRDRAEQQRLEREEAKERVRKEMHESEMNAELDGASDDSLKESAKNTTPEPVGFGDEAIDDSLDNYAIETPIDPVTATSAVIASETDDNAEFENPQEPVESSAAEEPAATLDHATPQGGITVPASTALEAPSAPKAKDTTDPGFSVVATEIEMADKETTELYDPTAELSKYTLPTLDLLNEPTSDGCPVDLHEQEENKERITKTLNDYKIPISHIEATVGPTVTLYEIIPAEGVRIATIKRLEDDIAMSLSAIGIRIIAPMPGKGTIGIEVPNKDPQTVSIKSILGSKKFQETKCRLPMAMGATISNDVYIADLTKMPHLLVAGATGMGKSVGLNTIIASLLYKKHPAELKFVLVDPKMVEFSLYSVLERHFLAKLPDEEEAVVTDMDKVVRTLKSLCVEMDQRYLLLKDANVRSITEYNERFVQKRLNPEKGHRYLPYIVMIVDEFADLIMTAGKDVETPIARIAQKARAVGMHMIVATQRPSTNVITGIIKANFPGRIAFRVSQMVDSKTILDRTGANQLIGRGDMLFSVNGSMDRVQCAFIDTDEVQAICDHIEKQVSYPHAYYLPEPLPDENDPSGMGPVGERDPLFEDAARKIVSSGLGSTSSLQRVFQIGYNRAGKIMDQMEAAGIVGPSQGGKPRQVLIDTMQLERILES